MTTRINFSSIANIGTNLQKSVNKTLAPYTKPVAQSRTDAFVGAWKQSVNTFARGASAAPRLLDVIPGPTNRVTKMNHGLRLVTGGVGAFIGLFAGKAGKGFDVGQAAGAKAIGFAAQVSNVAIASAKGFSGAIGATIGAVFGVASGVVSAARFKKPVSPNVKVTPSTVQTTSTEGPETLKNVA